MYPQVLPRTGSEYDTKTMLQNSSRLLISMEAQEHNYKTITYMYILCQITCYISHREGRKVMPKSAGLNMYYYIPLQKTIIECTCTCIATCIH